VKPYANPAEASWAFHTDRYRRKQAMNFITKFAFAILVLSVSACAERSPDPGTPPDGGTVTPPGGGGGTVTPPTGGGGGTTTTSPSDAWVMRSCGTKCVEFNPAYLQCALAGTCGSLTDVGQIAALITAAPSEARMVGECAAVSPTVTGWTATSGNVQAVLHKDSTTGWYRVDGGLNGSSNSTCNISFIAVGCQAGDSHCWAQFGTAPLSDLGSHTGGPGMYCVLDTQGHSTGCALEYFLDSTGNATLTGQLPTGP